MGYLETRPRCVLGYGSPQARSRRLSPEPAATCTVNVMRFCTRHVFAAALLLCLSVAVPSSAEPAGASAAPAPARGLGAPVANAPPAAPEAPTELAGAKKCTPAEQCCRICDVGKACGKSRTQATKTCHKGRTCACDASEVCAPGE